MDFKPSNYCINKENYKKYNIENILAEYSETRDKNIEEVTREYNLLITEINSEEYDYAEFEKKLVVNSKISNKLFLRFFNLFAVNYPLSEIKYITEEINLFKSYSELTKYLLNKICYFKRERGEFLLLDLDKETKNFYFKMNILTDRISYKITELLGERPFSYENNNNLFVRGNIGEHYTILEVDKKREKTQSDKKSLIYTILEVNNKCKQTLLVDKSLDNAKIVLRFKELYKVKNILMPVLNNRSYFPIRVAVGEVFESRKTITLLQLGNDKIVSMIKNENNYSFHNEDKYYIVEGKYDVLPYGEENNGDTTIKVLAPMSLLLTKGDLVLVNSPDGPRYLRISQIMIKHAEDFVNMYEVISKAKREFKYEGVAAMGIKSS